jgi:hypothetical protein
MAKKQTRRSISVSRVTYERLKAFCETNGISMSQFVETRVGDFLGEGAEGDSPTAQTIVASFHNHSQSPSHSQGNGNGQSHGSSASNERAERPALSPVGPRAGMSAPSLSALRPVASTSMSSISSGSSAAPAPRAAAPITSAAARFAVEPPPPIIKPRADQPAPPVAPRTADQIFTF